MSFSLLCADVNGSEWGLGFWHFQSLPRSLHAGRFRAPVPLDAVLGLSVSPIQWHKWSTHGPSSQKPLILLAPMSTCASAHRVLPPYWHCSFICPTKVPERRDLILSTPVSLEPPERWKASRIMNWFIIRANIQTCSVWQALFSVALNILPHFIFATPPWSRYYYPNLMGEGAKPEKTLGSMSKVTRPKGGTERFGRRHVIPEPTCLYSALHCFLAWVKATTYLCGLRPGNRASPCGGY